MKRIGALSACVGVLCAACVLGGCGKKDTRATSTMTRPPARPEHKAAAGTAIDKVTIDQLVLDSPVSRKKDPNGLEFLHFKYTDNDGKVYMCVLPAAMAEGEHGISEWLGTFNVYRRPEVLAQKTVDKKPGEKLGDFPFISPRPGVQEKKQDAPKPAKPRVTLPAMPAAPVAPASGRRSSGRPATPNAQPAPPSGPGAR